MFLFFRFYFYISIRMTDKCFFFFIDLTESRPANNSENRKERGKPVTTEQVQAATASLHVCYSPVGAQVLNCIRFLMGDPTRLTVYVNEAKIGDSPKWSKRKVSNFNGEESFQSKWLISIQFYFSFFTARHFCETNFLNDEDFRIELTV